MHGGTCPHCSKIWVKCPFSCNLVGLLESFEDAKKTSKIHVSSDFRRSKFQNSPGGAWPWTPLANLHLGTGPFSSCKEFYRLIGCLSPNKELKSQLKKPCQGAPQSMCPPHFCNASYVPDWSHCINGFGNIF